MSARVIITEVAPRDGLQNEAGVIPTDDKLRLIGMLADCAVDEIEATSFVSPKWVPQLADAEAVVEAIMGRKQPPRYSVLVPNKRGFDRFQSFVDRGAWLKLAVFTAASESFSQKNTNASIEDSIERFREFVPDALAQGIPVRLYISCVIACPYEGDIEPRRVREVADDLMSLAPQESIDRGLIEIDLGDTIGVGAPADIIALLSEFDESVRSQRLVLHLHDTHGRAAECVRAGLQMGVKKFDSSAAGLGGCPFAGSPENPAPGNIATSILVETLRSEGFACGVDIDKLRTASEYAASIVARARAQQVS